MGGDDHALLRIENLRTYFRTDAGLVRAADGVSLDIRQGETLALVGESGCGKSVTAMSILRLNPTPPAEIASGAIWFGGEDLVKVDEARMRAVRGNEIAMIFQEPMTSLNPVFTIGNQIIEAVELHQDVSHAQARERAIGMLRRVGIPAPERRVDEYPHQLSGGMRQRAMIAMALSCNPKLLIADEPTTALDVTIQAQILELLKRLQRDFGMSILLITHDLGIVADMARRVAVMYAGKIVEKADIRDLFKRPMHPYTVGLLKSVPRVDVPTDQLLPIQGMVPDALHMPPGCRFHPRCPFAMEVCRRDEPPLVDYGSKRAAAATHESACWFVEKNRDWDFLARPEPPTTE
ncbi:MAG: ABC transporter ATP-binding protein [Candidatus Sumerlaeota bacterium]|nr:ABC transporter ATP-binding protein [Candidatus Sumerlaeota bacterium]